MLGISDRLESEAFFAGPYYDEWLRWIETESRSDRAAGKLCAWLAAERVCIETFIARYLREKAAPNGDTAELLDIGCGFGRHMVDLLTRFDHLRALGIDINEGMINRALEATHAAHLDQRASFLVRDVADLSNIGADSVDVAICMTNTLGNISGVKQAALMSGLRTVLRPGGRALFSVYSLGSAAERLTSYEAIGLEVRERDSKVISAQGLQSQQFSADDLRTLVTSQGLVVTKGPTNIAEIGLSIVAERPGGPSAAR